MAKEKSSGLGVYNVYGPRKTDEGRVGDINTAGVVKEMQIDFRGDTYGYAEGTLPAGAKVLDAYAKVSEAFALSGTTPTIAIGTSGSAPTNGVKLTEAQAEATGTYALTPAGTWANVLATAVNVRVELGGTTPVSAKQGNASVVIRYVVV